MLNANELVIKECKEKIDYHSLLFSNPNYEQIANEVPRNQITYANDPLLKIP